MNSIFRDKIKTDELLDQMCGKQAVAEKFKSHLSTKVAVIPKDESDSEKIQEVVADEKNMLEEGVQENKFNFKEKQKVAENIRLSVKNYKEQVKAQQAKKDDVKPVVPKTGEENNIAFNCPLPEGTIINGRYRLVGKSRQGGFGMTYVATRVGENDGDMVVVKELYPYNAQRDVKSGKILFNYKQNEGKELLENFQKEAERIEKLKKDNPEAVKKMNLVITKTEAFDYNGNWYYVMEHVPGNSLADIMFSFSDNAELNACLPVHYRFQIMDQLCNALQNLHNIGCIHQDITPSNIMINFDDNANLCLKVIDYGLATNLYNFGDLSHSCIKYAGTHGFSDVLSQFAKYQDISNEIAKAEQTGDIEKKNRLTEKLKCIDVYSLGAVLGYLFLLNVSFIKSQNFNLQYELNLNNNSLVQLLEINLEEENVVIANKYRINLIKKLVYDSTIKKLSDRVPNVEAFRTRLCEIMKVDDEFIRRLKMLSEITLWKNNVEGISVQIINYSKKVDALVKDCLPPANKNEAQNEYNKGCLHLNNADVKRNKILQMAIDAYSDLDYILNEIGNINAEYKEAYACLENAEILAVYPNDGGHIPIDGKIIYIRKWLQTIDVNADRIKFYGVDIKDKIEKNSKTIEKWNNGLVLFRQAETYKADVKAVLLDGAENSVLDDMVEKTHLADNCYSMAEKTWKDIEKSLSNKTFIDIMLKVFCWVILATVLGTCGYYGWDYIDKYSAKQPTQDDDIKAEKSANVKAVESMVVLEPKPEVTISHSSEPISNEYLNDIFEKAQQKNVEAKLQLMDLLDDMVLITEKEGTIDVDTNLDKESFFGVGNVNYIIGKTYKISRFVQGKDGRIHKIVLEKLN